LMSASGWSGARVPFLRARHSSTWWVHGSGQPAPTCPFCQVCQLCQGLGVCVHSKEDIAQGRHARRLV
jgi:hypothetical protein